MQQDHNYVVSFLILLMVFPIIDRYHQSNSLIETESMNQDTFVYLLYSKIDKIHLPLQVKPMTEMLLYHDELILLLLMN